jgi:hypothetical protein
VIFNNGVAELTTKRTVTGYVIVPDTCGGNSSFLSPNAVKACAKAFPFFLGRLVFDLFGIMGRDHWVFGHTEGTAIRRVTARIVFFVRRLPDSHGTVALDY